MTNWSLKAFNYYNKERLNSSGKNWKSLFGPENDKWRQAVFDRGSCYGKGVEEMLPARLERATPGLEDRCSIQLSYGSVKATKNVSDCRRLSQILTHRFL